MLVVALDVHGEEVANSNHSLGLDEKEVANSVSSLDSVFTSGPFAVDLLQIAAHEIGHAIGIGHSEVPASLMYAFYQGFIPDLQLHSDDITAVQALYGEQH